MELRPVRICSLTCFALYLSFVAGIPVANAQREPLVAVNGLATPSTIGPKATLNEAARPAPNRMLHLTFSLKGARTADLEAFIATQHDPASPNYHQWLKPDEVGTRFGASDADLTAVVQYARAQGFDVSVWPNHMFVSVAGTVAQVENALHVTLHGYNRPVGPNTVGLSTTYYAPSSEPILPASIAARVEAIFGLTDALQMRRVHQQGSLPPGQNSGGTAPINPPGNPGLTPQFTQPLDPADVTKVYNFTGLHSYGLTGSGYQIGIFSPTEMNTSDVTYYCNYWGLGTPSIHETKIDGGATDYSGELEACLDAEMILGQAPEIQVVYYESPNNGNFDVWNRIISDNIAVLSDSWAYNEYDLVTGGYTSFMSAYNVLLATMDTQGQAHYNSSGDSGASPGGTLAVDYPGSSPHVTSVGGTSLYSDSNGNWASETGWSGSGGGLSIFFTRPSWQIGPGVSNSFSNGMRQMPDIAAISDPSTPGYYVYSGGGWYQVGGTSVAAPLWSVANQLINQGFSLIEGSGHRTGVLNPEFYGLGNAYSTQGGVFCYHDITSGSNGEYSCTPGWDYVTGWGSADFTKLAYDLAQNYAGQAYVDLAPYNPGSVSSGVWTSPIMIHQSTSSLTEPTTFHSNTTYYIAVAIVNQGIADSLPNNQSVQIDGVNHKFSWGPFATGWYTYNTEILSTQFTPGTHTIKLIANVDNTIKESNTANNIYTRTIKVVAP